MWEWDILMFLTRDIYPFMRSVLCAYGIIWVSYFGHEGSTMSIISTSVFMNHLKHSWFSSENIQDYSSWRWNVWKRLRKALGKFWLLLNRFYSILVLSPQLKYTAFGNEKDWSKTTQSAQLFSFGQDQRLGLCNLTSSSSTTRQPLDQDQRLDLTRGQRKCVEKVLLQ